MVLLNGMFLCLLRINRGGLYMAIHNGGGSIHQQRRYPAGGAPYFGCRQHSIDAPNYAVVIRNARGQFGVECQI